MALVLPDERQLSPLPSGRSGRVIASFDTTGYGEGLKAFGEGVRQFGAAFERAKKEMEADWGKTDELNAESAFQKFKAAEEDSYNRTVRTMKPGAAKGFADTYTKGYKERADEFARSYLTTLKPKQRLDYDMKLFEVQRWATNNALEFEYGEQKRAAVASIDDAVNNVILPRARIAGELPPNDPRKRQMLDDAERDALALIDKDASLTPIQKEEKRRAVRQKVQETFAFGLPSEERRDINRVPSAYSPEAKPNYIGGKLPVSIRNNNMGAISIVGEGNAWVEGLPGYVGKTPRPANEGGYYAKFSTPEAGVNAASELLIRYGKNGLNTASKIVRKWAADSTAWGPYATVISKFTGKGADEELDLNDPAVRKAVLMAQSQVEAGINMPAYNEDVFDRGVAGKVGDIPSAPGWGERLDAIPFDKRVQIAEGGQKDLDAERAEQERIARDGRTEIVKMGDDLMRNMPGQPDYDTSKPTLTEEWLAANRDNLSPGDRRRYITALDREGDEAIKTSPQELLRLDALVEEDPKGALKDLERQYADRVINRGNYNQLKGRAQANIRGDEQRLWVKDIRGDLSQYLESNASIGSSGAGATIEALSRVRDAKTIFDDWVARHKDASYAEVAQFADSLARNHRTYVAEYRLKTLPLPRYLESVPREAINADVIRGARARVAIDLAAGTISESEAANQQALMRQWEDLAATLNKPKSSTPPSPHRN